jgi:tRNA pseudouridine38-40 synthase
MSLEEHEFTKMRLQLRYDGTDFEGWQRQLPGKRTVQAELEIALSRIFNSRITVIGSGRTDSGVHAEAQVAHFILPKPPKLETFIKSVNSVLPKEIAIERAWLAPEEFHAQRSCLQKTYRYLIHNGPTPDPLRSRYTTWYNKELSLQNLNEMAKLIIGEHDFKSFQSAGTKLRTSNRYISEAKWQELAPKLIEFRVTGTGFLKQMVRNLVGTMLYLDRQNQGPEEFLRIIEAKARTAAKTTAPPEGLHLHAVQYPSDLDNKCREI